MDNPMTLRNAEPGTGEATPVPFPPVGVLGMSGGAVANCMAARVMGRRREIEMP